MKSAMHDAETRSAKVSKISQMGHFSTSYYLEIWGNLTFLLNSLLKGSRYWMVVISNLVLASPNIQHVSASSTFSAIGGSYGYEQFEELMVEVSGLSAEKTDFLVHLGGFIEDDDCNELSHATLSSFLIQSSEVPSILIPGKSDWYDCQDPFKALDLWKKYFVGFEQYWSHSFSLQRQNGQEENFIFLHGDCLFIGMRLLSENSFEIISTLEWVSSQLTSYENQFEALFIFGDVGFKENYDSLVNVFYGNIEDSSLPIIYLFQSTEDFSFDQNQNRVRFVKLTGSILPLQTIVIDNNTKSIIGHSGS